jgi:RsiW-degrading membrane proteinase PrsW (M82 family)
VIVIGCAAAFISYGINKVLLNLLQIDLANYRIYIAPIIEESLKAAFIIYMISKKEIGFMIDAVIYGFAIGAGFAFVENIYYLSVVDTSSIFLWIIRGFGTAVMHGGTTAIFAILTKNIFDRSDRIKILNYLPGLISAVLYHSLFLIFMPGLFSAIIIHSVFNQLLLPAITITLFQLILLPMLIMFVFHRSEIALRDWMETGLDNEVNLLEQIDNGTFSESHAGQYLLSLQNKFSGTVLADMLCSIRIHVELSIRAKGVLLLRKAGLPVILEDEIKEKFNELKFLEKSIGPTGKLAIAPIFKMSTRDLWQFYMLGLK